MREMRNFRIIKKKSSDSKHTFLFNSLIRTQTCKIDINLIRIAKAQEWKREKEEEKREMSG